MFQGFPLFDFEEENAHSHLDIVLLCVVCEVLIPLSDSFQDLSTEREKRTLWYSLALWLWCRFVLWIPGKSAEYPCFKKKRLLL